MATRSSTTSKPPAARPAGQLGRPLAGAGRVRVADRVHARTVSGSLADSGRFQTGLLDSAAEWTFICAVHNLFKALTTGHLTAQALTALPS